MKHTLLIAMTAAAALALPVAPTANAGEFRRDVPAPRHDHDPSEFVVHYSLAGHRTRAADSRDRAERRVSFLQSVGADAHLDSARVVHYHLHGRRRLAFHSHEAAHELAGKLRNFGFEAHVDHE